MTQLQCSSSRVKTLTDRFTALEQQAATELSHERNASNHQRHLVQPRGPQYVVKVRTVRIGDVENLMTGAVTFLIKQNDLGFYEKDDLFRYPKHGEGPRRKCFFTKLFAMEVTLNDWNPTELVSALSDLKSLNFSQLLFLWKVAALSGRTAKGVQWESCNREHVSFKDAVQSLVFDRILLELISPKRRCRERASLGEESNRRPDGICSARLRQNSSAAVTPSEGTAGASVVPEKRHPMMRPCDDISWPLANASAGERRAVGKEILVVLGLICRIVSEKDGHPGTQPNRKLSRSHTTEATICRPASVPEDNPETTGVWWRVFVARPNVSGLMGPREVTAPPSRVWRANSFSKPKSPQRMSGVETSPPAAKAKAVNKQTKPKSAHRRQNSTRSEPPKQDKKRNGSPENYLVRARCALRPVNRSAVLPPKAVPPPRFTIPMTGESPRKRPSIGLLEQLNASKPVAPPIKAQTTPALPARSGSWRRGVSLFQTSTTAPTPGIELFLHFPSLRVSTHRPPGIPIFSYIQQAGMTSLLTAATGGSLSTAATWDVIRFSPDAPTLNHVSMAESLSACMSELKSVLNARQMVVGPEDVTDGRRVSFSLESDVGESRQRGGTFGGYRRSTEAETHGILRRLTPTEESNSSTTSTEPRPSPHPSPSPRGSPSQLSFETDSIITAVPIRSPSPPRPERALLNTDTPVHCTQRESGSPSQPFSQPQPQPQRQPTSPPRIASPSVLQDNSVPRPAATTSAAVTEEEVSFTEPVAKREKSLPPPVPLTEPQLPESRRTGSWAIPSAGLGETAFSRHTRAGRTFDASYPVFNGRRLGPRASSPPKTIPASVSSGVAPVAVLNSTPRREKTSPLVTSASIEATVDQKWSTGRPRSGAFAAPPLPEGPSTPAHDFVRRMERLSEVARSTTPVSPPRPTASSWGAVTDDRELMSVASMPLTSEISTINDIPLLENLIRKKKRKASSRRVSVVAAIELQQPPPPPPPPPPAIEPVRIPYAQVTTVGESKNRVVLPDGGHLPRPPSINLSHFKHLDPLRLSERCAGWPCIGGESTPRPPSTDTQSERPVARRRSDAAQAAVRGEVPTMLLLPKYPIVRLPHIDRTRSLHEFTRPPTPRSRNVPSPAELVRMRRPPPVVPPPTAVPEPLPPARKAARPLVPPLSGHHNPPKN